MKNTKFSHITIVWIVLVSIFMFYVLDNTMNKTLSQKYIKNDGNEKVIKSETKNTIEYKIEDSSGNYLYSWTFNKDNSLETKEDIELEKEIDFNIQTDVINPKIEKLTKTDDKLVVTFSYHGDLPTKSKVELNVSDKYEDGEKLYLYYFNEDENVIEYIDNDIVVKNGYADFTIEHCSEYILSKTKISNSVNNPIVPKSYIFYSLMALIIIVAIKNILFK